MSWVLRAVTSPVGAKVVMAVTGLALIGFVIIHMLGNFLVYLGPEAINSYAEGLRKLGGLLWLARIGLLVAFVVHIAMAVKLTLANKAARPVGYQYKATVKASLASRLMPQTGFVILAFLIYHLAHLTFRLTDASFQELGPFDVYTMVVRSFSDPVVAGTYIVAMIALGLHLYHGASSLWQSLGINHPRWNKCLRMIGPVLGIVLALGNISIPVSIFLGIIK